MGKGLRYFEDGKEINVALGVQIVIPQECQEKGISSLEIVEIKNMCF